MLNLLIEEYRQLLEDRKATVLPGIKSVKVGQYEDIDTLCQPVWIVSRGNRLKYEDNGNHIESDLLLEFVLVFTNPNSPNAAETEANDYLHKYDPETGLDYGIIPLLMSNRSVVFGEGPFARIFVGTIKPGETLITENPDSSYSLSMTIYMEFSTMLNNFNLPA